MKTQFSDTDTIAAIATPMGPGAIGIVKISGPLCLDIFHKIFKPARAHSSNKYPQSHKLYYGWIIDQNGEKIDEVLCTFMKAPHSYTTQDVIEIQSHSGPAVLKAILETVLKHGARLAEPGEFTKRAFLGGRIDLSQAEAVLKLSTARTDIQRKAALNLLEGKLSSKLLSIKQELLNALAAIEVAIDFPDELQEIETETNVITRLEENVIQPIKYLLRRCQHSRIYQEGIRIVICGRPNVGKSSLLNEILNEERAIVTDIPGTTRDVIYESVIVNGIPLTFIDTAGLRDTKDPVEAIGVKRVQKELERSDIVLWLIDIKEGLTKEDLLIAEKIKDLNIIIVLNKKDLLTEDIISKATKDIITSVETHLKRSYPYIIISAKQAEGIEQLNEMIIRKVMGENININPPEILLDHRHKNAFLSCLNSTNEAITHIKNGLPELAAIELNQAIDKIETITGESTKNELLDTIFSRFCLGK